MKLNNETDATSGNLTIMHIMLDVFYTYYAQNNDVITGMSLEATSCMCVPFSLASTCTLDS